MLRVDGFSDSLLVRRSVDGDTRSFAVLIRRYDRYLRAYAIRLVGASDADDVVQDAFITAWSKLETLEDPASFKAWVRRITSTTGIDVIRSRRSNNAELDDTLAAPDRESPENRVEASTGVEALSHALDRLDGSQRECWVLREIDGLRYEEIAERLDVTPSVVRGRLARARATLVRELDGWR